MTALYGTNRMSSWSCPKLPDPLASSQPTMVKGAFLMRINCPTGSIPSPNRVFAVVDPMRQTLLALRTSVSLKFSPPRSPHERAVRYSALTPDTCTNVFWLPTANWAWVRASGLAAVTPETSLRMAS
jgi:hypothetical protein